MTFLKQGYDTLTLPLILIPEDLVKGWATPSQEEMASPFPAAGASLCLGAVLQEQSFLGVPVGSHSESGCCKRGSTGRK